MVAAGHSSLARSFRCLFGCKDTAAAAASPVAAASMVGVEFTKGMASGTVQMRTTRFYK